MNGCKVKMLNKLKLLYAELFVNELCCAIMIVAVLKKKIFKILHYIIHPRNLWHSDRKLLACEDVCFTFEFWIFIIMITIDVFIHLCIDSLIQNQAYMK